MKKPVAAKVRLARPEDAGRIIQIERSWAHLSHWSADAYRRLLEEASYTSSFVAEAAAGETPEIVGFVIFHVVDRVSEIYNIAVDHGHARQGVGQSLMRTVIEQSRARGAWKLVLEVRKSNWQAIRFYSRFDFKVSGERHNYYSNPLEDAYVMERDLRI